MCCAQQGYMHISLKIQTQKQHIWYVQRVSVFSYVNLKKKISCKHSKIAFHTVPLFQIQYTITEHIGQLHCVTIVLRVSVTRLCSIEVNRAFGGVWVKTQSRKGSCQSKMYLLIFQPQQEVSNRAYPASKCSCGLIMNGHTTVTQ